MLSRCRRLFSSSSLIRNIGIIAHIDAGKTTSTERLIHKTGLTRRAGSIDSGDTVMDYLPEERERGITIASAAITLPWRGFRLNVIDTPGHVDFTVEVERSLRVMDAAVVILDASKGVQAQTMTVWRQARRHGLKTLVYINKMDKVGANLEKCLQDIRVKLELEPILLNEPTKDHLEEFSGVKPCEMLGIQEKVAQYDDGFLEKYLSEEATSSCDVREALARITERGTEGIVCIVGSSAKDVGIEGILDGIVDYFPCPKEEEVTDNAVFKALAFKVVFDAKRNGFLVYCRVYSGVFSVLKRPVLFNVSKQKKEQANRIMQVMADELIEVEEASSGQIVILTGLKYTATGDTLSDAATAESLAGIDIPSPVISVSVEAESPGAQDHLDTCLALLQLEDPSARVFTDKQTGQTVLSGMGELHLEILKGRLQRDFKAKFRTGPIEISLQESLLFNFGESCLSLDHSIDREVHGIKLKGSVRVSVECAEIFEISIKGCSLDETLKQTVIDAVEGAFGFGPLAGQRVERKCRVLIEKLDFLAANSAHVVVYEALQELFKKAAASGQLELQEPLVRIEIEAPDACLGDITSDLYSSRACIECEMFNYGLRAKVPLKRVLGYAQWLRTRTAGMAAFSIESAGWTSAREST